MNKFYFFVLSLIASNTFAQTVTVTKQNEKVKNESIEVFATTIEGRKEDVTSAWNKFLKEVGKLKQSSDPMTVSEPLINNITYAANLFYAQSKRVNDNTTMVWAGIVPAEWNEADVEKIKRGLEKLVYQFGVTYYRNRVQTQIDETQQAIDAVEKQKQRITSQYKDLNIKLGNNEQEKVQLEKSLETNKLEYATLKIKLEKNKKAQDSLANVGVQIKKVMEQHKEKQRKIN